MSRNKSDRLVFASTCIVPATKLLVKFSEKVHNFMILVLLLKNNKSKKITFIAERQLSKEVS